MMATRTREKRAAALAVLISVPVAAGAFASGAVGRALAGRDLTWSRPILVDRHEPYSHAYYVGQVQCPSSELCLAVDERGDLLTSTDPAGGSWEVASLPLQRRGNVLSCPSTHLCLVGGTSDDVLLSSSPAGGARTWKTIKLPGSAPIESVACAGISLCLAVDMNGNVLSSTDPTGGGGAWQEHSSVFPNGPPDEISCPSTSFCAAPDGEPGHPGEGAVYTSQDPTGGASAWHRQVIDHSRDGIGSISCPSAQLCVAVDLDGTGNVLSSTSPTTGPWKSVLVNRARDRSSAGIWCALPTRCVTSFLSGDVFVSSNPAGGSEAWTRTDVGGRGFLSVSCPVSDMCVASNFRGQILTTSDPSAGHWHAVFADGSNRLTGVACPGQHLCVAVDDEGDVLTSGDPAGAGVWRAHRVDPTDTAAAQHGLVSIACPATTLCVALNSAGRLLSSGHPTRGRSAWRVIRLKQSLTSLACPTVRRCFAVDQDGHVWTTARPLDGPRAWSRTEIDGKPGPGSGVALTGIGCFRARLCVAGDILGNVLTSKHPTSRHQPWHEQPGVASKGTTVVSISCPSLKLCVISDVWDVFASANPTADRWTYQLGTGPNYGEDLRSTCATAHLCFAYGSGGVLYTSTDPAGGPSAWHSSTIDPGTDIDDVACTPGNRMCVAVDSTGHVLTAG